MEYLVSIAVHSVSGLSFKDSAALPNPYVTVTVMGEKRQTHVVESASMCSFDHYFNISKRESPENFESSDIEVAVFHSARFGFATKLGSIVFGIQKVHAQPQHLVPKGWFPISLSDCPNDITGFVQLTIGAYAPGDRVPRSGGSGGDAADDGGEGQSVRSRVVALPSMDKGKSLFQLSVGVHQAQALRLIEGTFSSSCDPFVRVEFNGTAQQTQTMWGVTTPTWNEEIQVPFLMPCWDDSLNIRLFSSGGATSREVPLGEVCLNMDDLVSAELPPTWFPFYFTPSEARAGGLFHSSDAEEPSCFGGRLLLSARVTRTERPSLTVTSAPSTREPPVANHVLWADFYEVVFESPDLPEDILVSVSVPPFCEETRSKQPDRHARAFTWPGDAGRLEPQDLTLPAAEMCGDVIVCVHTRFGGWLAGGDLKRHMYCRIPVKTVYTWDQKPKWYEMRFVQAGDGHRVAGYVLISLNIGSQSDVPKRKPRIHFNLQTYCFRALIYQAANLPAKDGDGCADPFAVVFFGSATLRTQIITQTVNPSWYQALEADVELPDNEALRPDILLAVLDQDDDSSFDPLAILRYSTREPGALPTSWRGAPRWLNLERAPGGVPTQGRILVAFELDPKAKASPPRSIAPPSVDCRVDFFAVGVRLKGTAPELHGPMLEVAWGRKEDDRSSPKRAKYTASGTGRGGHFNFLQKVSMTCSLAKESHFQDWLEIKLLSESGEDQKEMKAAGFAAVHLGPYLPWLDQARRDRVEQTFRARRQSTAVAAEEEAPQAVPEEEAQQHTGGQLWRRYASAVKDQEKQICRSLGWDHDSIEASNARVIGFREFTNLTDQDQKDNQEILKQALAGDRFDEDFEWADAFRNFIREFDWPKDVLAIDGLDRHPDVDCPLEQGQLSSKELPYACTPIFVGSDWGEPETLGVLKFCLRVVEREKHKQGGPEVEQENAAWEQRLRDLEVGFKEARDLIVRAYILSADGLMPCSGSSDCSTYVWSKACRGDGDGAHSFRDNLTVRHHTLHPQFHKCHTFSQCTMPDNCQMEFSIVELVSGMFGGAPTEEIIGSTIIDIEDRWFHPRYRKMVDDDIVPIEARDIYHNESIFSRGHLRLWLEILSMRQSQERRIVQLPSTEPAPFQLRIVIWRVTDVIQPEGESPDIYVSGRHVLDDGTVLNEQTDTHYNADDGIGTFNWRLIFDVHVPCRSARLELRVWNDKLLSGDDPLADVTLDLAKDFLSARKANRAVELPRGTVHLTHPAFPGEVRAVLDMEGLLLPADEAAMRQVGKGREEPNEDPFLDPDDPHLLAHRDYFNNLAIVRNVKAIGGALLAGMKWMTMLYVIGTVVSGLVMAGFTLYMFLSKTKS